MDNHTYDLVKVLGEVAESASVYDKYTHDTNSCQDCGQLYKSLKDEADKQVDVIKKLLITHAKKDQLT